MSCLRCGKCCEDMYIPLSWKYDDNCRWADLHEGIEVVKHEGLYCIHIKAKCSKLKDNLCTIYEDRPNNCKKYICKLQ